MVGSGRNGDQAGAGARLPNGLNALKQQAAVVRGEAQRKARFTPLRKLLAQAADILLALRPHWVASPLNVSRLLPQTSWFDLVLIDEGAHFGRTYHANRKFLNTQTGNFLPRKPEISYRLSRCICCTACPGF